MKRLLLLFFVALFPLALAAQVPDRDVLVTPDGTLYTVESVPNNGVAAVDVQQYLLLTVQRNGKQQQTIVPESAAAAGIHWRPALAYDVESNTLFVFWLHMPNAMSSELLLAPYANANWQPALSIDNQSYRLRFNLRVGITRRVAQQKIDGSLQDSAMLLIHAIWWEETGYGEQARYGLFNVVNGQINSIELHNLDDFAPTGPMFPHEVNPLFNADILRHPAFADNGTQDSIDVIYGDTHNKDLVRVRVKPIQVEGRIHIPIGAHPGGPRVPIAKSFKEPWNGPITIVTSPHDDSMLFYNTTANAVNYLMYSNGTWSSANSVPLSSKLSAEAAVAALTRMLSQ